MALFGKNYLMTGLTKRLFSVNSLSGKRRESTTDGIGESGKSKDSQHQQTPSFEQFTSVQDNSDPTGKSCLQKLVRDLQCTRIVKASPNPLWETNSCLIE